MRLCVCLCLCVCVCVSVYVCVCVPLCLQTQISEPELAALVDEATDHDPDAEFVDYHAFVTKMMAT